jgi:hypothetical protein
MRHVSFTKRVVIFIAVELIIAKVRLILRVAFDDSSHFCIGKSTKSPKYRIVDYFSIINLTIFYCVALVIN